MHSKRVVQAIREEDTSCYLSSMFKSSSDNRTIEENMYFDISVQVVGQMTDGDLPNPNVVQTLLCTLYRSAYICGMIHERQIIAHVQLSKPLGLQAGRRLQRT